MAVYVDNCKLEYGRMKMAHMWSPDLEELNKFAQSIGLRREWLQDKHAYFIHYDCCQSKRKEAIEKGAIPVKVQDLVRTVSPNFEFTEEDLRERINEYKQGELI